MKSALLNSKKAPRRFFFASPPFFLGDKVLAREISGLPYLDCVLLVMVSGSFV